MGMAGPSNADRQKEGAVGRDARSKRNTPLAFSGAPLSRRSPVHGTARRREQVLRGWRRVDTYMLGRLAGLTARVRVALPSLSSRAVQQSPPTRFISLAAASTLRQQASIYPLKSLLRPALLSPPARSIIIIDVNQPADRGSGDPASRQAMLSDVQRAEEIAMAQFNRLVYQEVERGTLRPGRRGMKRFARYTKPHLQRRDARKRMRQLPLSCATLAAHAAFQSLR
jgi:hypothetical protein